jgi:hypothetical protein
VNSRLSSARHAPKNGGPPSCLLSAANSSAVITAAQPMTCVESPPLQTQTLSLFALEKAPLSAIFRGFSRGLSAGLSTLGQDGHVPHRNAQQSRDDRFTRSSPSFHHPSVAASQFLIENTVAVSPAAWCVRYALAWWPPANRMCEP